MPYVPIDESEKTLCQQLQNDYGLFETHTQGWCLRKKIEWLDAAYLSAEMGCDVYAFDELTSTSKKVKNYAPPTAVLAEHQSQGRGQQANRWLSIPADAITLSIILPCPPTIMGLSVAIGAAIWQNLDAKKHLCLKWPNDILDIHQNKVGGILTEVRGDVVIVGVGINRLMTTTLNRQITAMGRPASGLNTTMGNEKSRNQLALAVLKAVCTTTMNFQRGLVAYQAIIDKAHRYKKGDRCIDSNQQGEIFSHINNEGLFCTLRGKEQKSYISAQEQVICG